MFKKKKKKNDPCLAPLAAATLVAGSHILGSQQGLWSMFGPDLTFCIHFYQLQNFTSYVKCRLISPSLETGPAHALWLPSPLKFPLSRVMLPCSYPLLPHTRSTEQFIFPPPPPPPPNEFGISSATTGIADIVIASST